MEDSQQKQPTTEAAPALSADGAVESSNSYAAVIENRAKEVGVAVLQLDTLKLHISQFIEAGRWVWWRVVINSVCTGCAAQQAISTSAHMLDKQELITGCCWL